MLNATEIALANLREALKRFDTYIQLALLASLLYSALALSEAAPSAQTSLGFFSLPIQLSRNALRSVLVGATFVFGMLSGTTLDQIHRALRHLASDRALLVAACGFPSLATNVDTLARRLPVLAPPVLIILASTPTVWAAEAAAWGGFGLLAGVVSIPFIFISSDFRIPLDDGSRYRYVSEQPTPTRRS